MGSVPGHTSLDEVTDEQTNSISRGETRFLRQILMLRGQFHAPLPGCRREKRRGRRWSERLFLMQRGYASQKNTYRILNGH